MFFSKKENGTLLTMANLFIFFFFQLCNPVLDSTRFLEYWDPHLFNWWPVSGSAFYDFYFFGWYLLTKCIVKKKKNHIQIDSYLLLVHVLHFPISLNLLDSGHLPCLWVFGVDQSLSISRSILHCSSRDEH